MNPKRYNRQVILDKIGKSGQAKLAAAHVIIIGCGGLGAIAATYLAGAGIGHLSLIDGDLPEISNLHRQVFYTPDTKTSKAEALSSYITKYNNDVKVSAMSIMVNKSNIKSLIKDADVVLECTDQVLIKYLVNDTCAIQHIPLVYGAIHKYDGYVSFFNNQKDTDIHLRDIFPEPNLNIPTCAEVGVVNTLAGIIGLFQANEALKHITGAGPTLNGKLLTYDIVQNDQMKLTLKKSFDQDISEVWKNNTYQEKIGCDIPEITIEEFITRVEEFQVVSILNDKHHENITEETIHMPAEQFNIYEWEPEEESPAVFYCTSGKVSLQLVLQLKEEYPDAEVLSLKGGIKAYRKWNAAKDEH
jgi:adenylyltransferase/sulfurtransferase